jgi:DNA invertase Pin-like site-specific DNA recombinase
LTTSKDDPVTTQGDHPLLLFQPKKQRRPGPKNPKYGIPREQWPDVIRRVEQGESLRQVGKDYNVSYETIRRVLKAARKQQEKGDR